MASPLARTIQTTLFVLETIPQTELRRDRILAFPAAQETFDYPFNTGSDYGALEERCKQHCWPVDLSLVEEGWTNKRWPSRYYPGTTRFGHAPVGQDYSYGQRFETGSGGVENPVIVLVTHGSFLHYLTDDWEHATKLSGTGWANCECRPYVYERGVAADDDPDARLVEAMDSRRRRGVDPAPLSRDRQQELFLEAVRGWVDQGLPGAIALNSTKSDSSTI